MKIERIHIPTPPTLGESEGPKVRKGGLFTESGVTLQGDRRQKREHQPQDQQREKPAEPQSGTEGGSLGSDSQNGSLTKRLNLVA